MTDFKKLNQGEVLSETQYYKVAAFLPAGYVGLINDKGDKIKVDANYVNSSLSSSAQFEKEEKVTKTRLAEIFSENKQLAMTVNFNKKVDEKDVVEGLASIYGNLKVGTTEVQLKKEIKKALNLKGEERTMVGRHYGSHDVNGRFHFIDMNIDKKEGVDYDSRQRLVDPRTLNYVIVGGTKYINKSK